MPTIWVRYNCLSVSSLKRTRFAIGTHSDELESCQTFRSCGMSFGLSIYCVTMQMDFFTKQREMSPVKYNYLKTTYSQRVIETFKVCTQYRNKPLLKCKILYSQLMVKLNNFIQSVQANLHVIIVSTKRKLTSKTIYLERVAFMTRVTTQIYIIQT